MKKITLLKVLFFVFTTNIYAQFPTNPESFEGTTFPPSGWAVFDNGVSAATNLNWETNSSACDGILAAYMNRQNVGAGNTSEDYLATPLVTIPTNGQLLFCGRSFTNGDTGTIYQVKIKLASSGPQNDITGYSVVQQFNETAMPTTYSNFIIDLSAYTGSEVYIAFVMKNTQATVATSGDRWLVDNVNLVEHCFTPTDSGVNSISSTSVNLSWTGNGTNYQIENNLAPFIPTGIATATVTSGTSFAQTGLLPNTQYYFSVREECSPGNFSAWTAPFYYTTQASLPICGGQFIDSGGVNGNYLNNENSTTTICPSNSNEIVTVTFTQFNLESNNDFLRVYDGNSATGNPIAILTGTTIPEPITATNPSGCLTFVFTSNFFTTSLGWQSNITCSAAPLCAIPYNLAVNNLTSTSAQLSWTQPANPDGTTATAWEYLLLPCGSMLPSSSTSGTVALSPLYLTMLSETTCYTVYIRAICSATDYSPWSLGFTFLTPLTSPTCGGQFRDTGGIAGNYQNNENITTIICTDIPGGDVTVTFNSFDTEAEWDALFVYDGNSSNATQIQSGNSSGNVPGGEIGGFWGTTIPGPFTSSNADGCLTFVFRSDSSITHAGWDADITCNSADRIVLNAFVDSNNNGIKDVGEVNFTNGSFLYDINNSGTTTNAFSPIGNYIILDSNSSNSYSFGYELLPEYMPYYNSGAASYNNIVITPGSGAQVLYFPIILTQTYNDVSISIIPSQAPRPGFTYENVLTYKNNGAGTTSGTITFENPQQTTITSISQTGTVLNSTGFTYDYTNLLPNEIRSIYLTMLVPSIPTVNINDLLTANASITSTTNDIDLSNNSCSTSQIVIASYDPNDKMESHGEKIVHSNFSNNDYLFYTIRFENTGTATAENIRIEDILDSKLDETSIRMISSSNNYILNRIGNNLIWKFDNIQLPISIVDTQTGKGYITFKIKPKPGFAVGDIIPNTANIYFDYNPAITTNTFNTEFVTTLSNASFTSNNFLLFPNPAKNKFQINLQNTEENLNRITFYDVLGKTLKEIKSISEKQITIDISDLSKGVYMIEMETKNGLKQIKKLVVE